ncbi:myosin head [Ancylostoma duodenale]|uniref:Myosin head n=1 Tax=Ancylostoma duodenale TaxID=51022 RepID=A0A0C2CJQ5_9BILA|nr:myosin head [Ancylostoma duodenale]
MSSRPSFLPYDLKTLTFQPLGLLSLLEEECVVPNGSDQSLLQKLCTNLEKFPEFKKAKPSQRCQHVRHFTVKHYAGSVDYNIDSWVEKNRDVVENAVLEVMGESTKALVRSLFPPVHTSFQTSLPNFYNGENVNCLFDGLRATSNKKLWTIVVAYCGHCDMRHMTHMNQLTSLLDTLSSSAAHFIRCVVPNYERVPGKIDGPLVLNQLRCNGVLEGIRICRQGYPSRLPFVEFVTRYHILNRDAPETGENSLDPHATGLPYATEETEVHIDCFCDVAHAKVAQSQERDKERILELEQLTKELQSENDQLRHENLKLSTSCDLLQEKVEEAEQSAEEARKLIEKEVAEKNKEIKKVRMEMQQNEEVFELLEKKYSEQHQKVMERDKERILELEQLTEELRSENDQLRHENLKLSTSCDLLQEKVEEAEQSAEEARKLIEKEVAEKNKEIKKVRLEMQQNEEVFELLEKKYSEQHQKVMKMNESLREYERKLDQVDMEKEELQKEIKKLRELFEKEKSIREAKEKECEENAALVAELEGRIARLTEEADQWKLKLEKDYLCRNAN